jgi:broad specificity phosphatase PhoE
MAVVFLIRHAETHYNVLNILTGRGSDPALTNRGVEQAHYAARHILENHVQDIELIVSSNMTRTNQTADIIRNYLEKDVAYDSLIQEIDRGGFEGHSKEYALPIINSLGDHESHPIHGGESLNEFKGRVAEALCSYLYLPIKGVLLVTHGYVVEKALEFFIGDQDTIAHNAKVYILDPINISDLAGKCNNYSDDTQIIVEEFDL